MSELSYRKSSPWLAANRLLPAAALLSLAAVGAALVSQHLFDMQPCPWCVLQRVVFLAIALAALLAWLLGGLNTRLRQAGAGLMLLLAAGGVAAALWQHFVAASSTSCQLSMAERMVSALGIDQRWPEVFVAYASCADAKVDLLGIPYEFYSLLLFVLLGVVALQVMRRPR